MSFSGQSYAPWQSNVLQGRIQSSGFLQDTQRLMQNGEQNNMVAFSRGDMQHGGNATRGGMGTVTKIGNNCGLINDEVFFYRNVCKGDLPILGDLVMYEASFTNNGQFKWDAFSVELLKKRQEPQTLMGSSKESYSSVVPLNDYRSQIGQSSHIRGIHERDPRRREYERMHQSCDRDEDDYEYKRRRKEYESSRDRLALTDSRSGAIIYEEHGNDGRNKMMQLCDSMKKEQVEIENARNKELQVAECGMLYTRRYSVQVPKTLLWQTSPMPPVPNGREQTTTVESSLALVVHNATNLEKNEISKKEELKDKEKNALRMGLMQSTVMPTVKNSNSVSILVDQIKDEANKIVNRVGEGIASHSKTKRKRLSGAQRKKLKKKRQLNILEQLRDDTKEKSNLPSISVDNAKRIRTPNYQNSECTLLSPVVNNTLNEKVKEKEGANRIRSIKEQDTEMAIKNKKSSSSNNKPENFWQMSRQSSTSRVGTVNPFTEKISNPANNTFLSSAKNLQSTWKIYSDADKDQAPPSYAEMTRKKRRNDLCFEIYDAGNRTGRIPDGRQIMIEDLINNKIVDHAIVTNGQQPIEIMKSEFKNGVMVMKLATRQSARILQALVESIPPPWDGAKLKLMKKREPVKLTKTTLYIKGWGSKFTNERILEILGSQNTNLAVEKFMVFHRKELSEGTLLVIGIDQISMASLVKNRGKAFFASNTVRFRIGKVPIHKAVTEGLSKGIKAIARSPAVKKGQESQPACGEVLKRINNSHRDTLLGGHN